MHPPSDRRYLACSNGSLAHGLSAMVQHGVKGGDGIGIFSTAVFDSVVTMVGPGALERSTSRAQTGE